MATVARLKSDTKRAEIIELRYKGHTLEEVGQLVGLSMNGVKYHEDAWLASVKPSSEVTEARRQVQLAGIDALRLKLFEILEAEVETPARLGVVDRIAKLWEREAKLVGLDLQPGVQVGLLSRESLVAVLGLDAPLVIEGTAEEITDGSS